MIVIDESIQSGRLALIESTSVSEVSAINGQLNFQWDESAYAISFSVVSQIQ